MIPIKQIVRASSIGIIFGISSWGLAHVLLANSQTSKDSEHLISATNSSSGEASLSCPKPNTVNPNITPSEIAEAQSEFPIIQGTDRKWKIKKEDGVEYVASDKEIFDVLVEAYGGGWGMFFRKDESGTKITNVLPGLTAAKSGLESGDIIVSINNQNVADLPLSELVSLTRSGYKPITLLIDRDGVKREVKLTPPSD